MTANGPPPADDDHPSYETRGESAYGLGMLRSLSRPRLLRTVGIARQVVIHTYQDGFVLAGNFAYLSLLAVFPFFIIAAALGGVFGRTDYGYSAVQAFIQAVPPSVAGAISSPMEATMEARTGPLLWFGALVGLWTTASLIETIRDMLRRAYRFKNMRPFWQYRLGSIALIIGAVFVTLSAFSLQVMLKGVEQFVQAYLPFNNALGFIAWGQLATTLVLFGALFLVFRTLTPRRFLRRGWPVWPGPLFTSLWWMACTSALPFFLTNFTNYSLTYGSLAGVMISLIFFFLIGLGMVIGAELNAAIARDICAEQDGCEICADIVEEDDLTDRD